MSHPIDPDKEDTQAVFNALLATLPDPEHDGWQERWDRARAVERRRRDYSRSWDESLMGVTRFGQ